MSFLDKIQSGKRTVIPRIMVVGQAGVGKSTYASTFPNALFVDTEGRTDHLNINRLPVKNYADVKAAMAEIYELAKAGKNPCKWLVIDTVDHLALWVYDHVCAANNWDNIEEPGYGKGYAIARDTVWREFVQNIDLLRSANVGVLLLGHATAKSFQNPTGADYQYFGLNLDKTSTKYLYDKMDAIGFAAFEDDVRAKFDRRGEQITKGKASTTGRRMLYFGHNPAYDTKMGLTLPDEMELEYASLADALNQINKK